MEFGELLLQTRTAARLSLRDLGRKVGLSPVYLSYLEQGTRRAPELGIIRKIVAELGVDPAPFLEAALRKRDSIEIPVSERTRNFAIALAREDLESLDDEILAHLTSLIENRHKKEDQ